MQKESVMADARKNRFEGMSTLRAKEREQQPKSDQAKALEKYLLKYGDGNGAKPKKRKRPNAAEQTVRIIDLDEPGYANKAVKVARKKLDLATFMEQGDDEEDDDGPVVANPKEAEHLARLAAKERSGAASRNWEAVESLRPSTRDSQDESPPRRARHDTPDGSPPREHREDSPDESPPRRVRHDSPDESPPRKLRHDSPDESPPRRVRHDIHDESPLRRQRKADVKDQSPPRRKRQLSPDFSPPRAQKKAEMPDESPPRRQARANVTDELPARRRAVDDIRASLKASKKEGAKIMSDGTVAGMVSGEGLVAEMAQKRADEKKRFAKLEAASGSKHAETVFRNAETGARMSRQEYEAAAAKAAEKKKATYEKPEWGGGMKQIQEREQQAQDLIAERAKPFARTKDDVDRDLNLRDRSRFGDPMSQLVRQKEAAPPPPIIPERIARQMSKSGFIVPQDVPNHSWLKRNMGAPPNRYGIKPGRHWDGVDRSTGFERELFKMQASRAALEREARAWAQADM